MWESDSGKYPRHCFLESHISNCMFPHQKPLPSATEKYLPTNLLHKLTKKCHFLVHCISGTTLLGNTILVWLDWLSSRIPQSSRLYHVAQTQEWQGKKRMDENDSFHYDTIGTRAAFAETALYQPLGKLVELLSALHRSFLWFSLCVAGFMFNHFICCGTE